MSTVLIIYDAFWTWSFCNQSLRCSPRSIFDNFRNLRVIFNKKWFWLVRLKRTYRWILFWLIFLQFWSGFNRLFFLNLIKAKIAVHFFSWLNVSLIFLQIRIFKFLFNLRYFGKFYERDNNKITLDQRFYLLLIMWIFRIGLFFTDQKSTSLLTVLSCNVTNWYSPII